MRATVAALVVGILLSLTGCSSLTSPDEPQADPESSSTDESDSPMQVARVAALVTWNDQTPADQHAMCTAYLMRPQWAMEQFQSGMTDPDPELIIAFRNLLDQVC